MDENCINSKWEGCTISMDNVYMDLRCMDCVCISLCWMGSVYMY